MYTLVCVNLGSLELGQSGRPGIFAPHSCQSWGLKKVLKEKLRIKEKISESSLNSQGA